jgi:hypothetical protein
MCSGTDDLCVELQSRGERDAPALAGGRMAEAYGIEFAESFGDVAIAQAPRELGAADSQLPGSLPDEVDER